MKRKNGLRAIACFTMVAAMLFLTIPSFSLAELPDYDQEKLLAFWEQTDPEGIMCNGDRVYDIAFGDMDVNVLFGPFGYAPGSWETRLVNNHYIHFGLTSWYYIEFSFVDDTPEGPICVDAYDFVHPDLYGPLDMAGTSISSLDFPLYSPSGLYTLDKYSTHIESVTLDNCAKLKDLDFSGQEYCTSLSAVNCPKLETISARDCDYKSIKVQPKGYDNALNIAAVCDGSVGADFNYSPDGSTMTVYANSESNSFLGWYCNGNLVSTELEFNYTGTGNLTACFGGDADGDGVLSMRDCVTMSRAALGLIEADEIASDLDVDRNGTLAIADAVIIARIVLGV